jgi:hypothetical protein
MIPAIKWMMVPDIGKYFKPKFGIEYSVHKIKFMMVRINKIIFRYSMIKIEIMK